MSNRPIHSELKYSKPVLLGGAPAKKESLRNSSQQLGSMTSPSAAQRPSLSNGRLNIGRHPAIHQAVAGSGIEADHRAFAARQVRDIGDAADIDDNPIPVRGGKQPVMKRRHQGCALAADGDDRPA